MDPYRKLFWITLALLTLIRIWIIGQFELSPDEAYYWTWSRHLDWSYFDQGPMLALIIGLFTALAGSSNETSVRLGSVVLSAISSWIFFEWITHIFHKTRAGWYGYLIFQSALLISAGAVLMMHDSIMMCFWILSLYFFWRALCENWTPGWIGGSLALGLGVLSKYTMVLFIPCLLLFLLLSPEQRKWWRKPHLYLAGLLAALIILPLIIWNSRHGWASFSHVSDLGGAEKAIALSGKHMLTWFAGQLGVMTPFIAGFCLSAPVIGWQKWRQRDPSAKQYLFLACFSGPILLFFFLLSWHTEVYANWTAPAYPAAIALLAGWLVSLLETKPTRLLWIVTFISLGTGMTVTLLAHLQVTCHVLPLKGAAARSVDRIRGWSVMGTETKRLLTGFKQQSKTPVFLATRRYQIAGILSFYTLGHPEVQLLPLREPANNQYRFWDRSDKLAGQNALYVCEYYWETEHIRKNFERIEPLPALQITAQGRKIREIIFLYAYNYKLTRAPATHMDSDTRGGEPLP